MSVWPTGPVTVSVPATSANLGPGFDALGLALDLRDEVTAEVVDAAGVTVEIEGEGVEGLPRDESHLIAATLLGALEDAGLEPPGLRLTAVNRIPHGRGLGSSAAAIVAAVALARELTGGGASPISLDRAFDLCVDAEGHPDNVAPALLGGFTVAWPDLATGRPRALSLPAHPDVRATVCIPTTHMSTKAARGLLPDVVPHADASANAARCALLVHALTTDPSLLLEATVDLLHQPYRLGAMPQTAELIGLLRSRGLAAALSGSGPTVVVLSEGEPVGLEAPGFEVRSLTISPTGVEVARHVP